jgi:hypothetical protein
MNFTTKITSLCLLLLLLQCKSQESGVRSNTTPLASGPINVETLYFKKPSKEMLQAVQSVALVDVQVRYGTGFLIANDKPNARDYLLTSFRMVTDDPKKEGAKVNEAYCEGMQVAFGEHATAPNPGSAFSQYNTFPKRTRACKKVIIADQKLNIAILELGDLKGETNDIGLPFHPAKLSIKPIAEEEPLFVMGHPGGHFKTATISVSTDEPCHLGRQLVKDDSLLQNQPVLAMQLASSRAYRCPFAPDGDGSPVLNLNTLQVEAVHLANWEDSKRPFQSEDGVSDTLGNAEDQDIKYWPGSALIELSVIRDYLQNAGSESVPEAVRAAFGLDGEGAN